MLIVGNFVCKFRTNSFWSTVDAFYSLAVPVSAVCQCHVICSMTNKKLI